MLIELYHVANELRERLQRKAFRGNTLTLKIKYHDFTQITRSITQSANLDSLSVILPIAKELLKQVDYNNRPVRLIGLSVSNPREESENEEMWRQLILPFEEWK